MNPTSLTDKITATEALIDAVQSIPTVNALKRRRTRMCLSAASALSVERSRLVTYLERGFAYLEAHSADEGTPGYELRYDKWNAALADYQDIEDVLQRAMDVCLAPQKHRG